ncbi:MAG: murein hydrolase activator EnvC family protein [Rickettsiales bacterium]
MLLCSVPAFAATKSDLAKTRKEIVEAEKRKASIAEENKELRAELSVLQKQLVKAAARVQRGEMELSATEKKLRVLKRKVEEKQAALEKGKKHLAALVQVSLRLSRMPPEAMVLMPGDSEKTMKASRAVRMASADIKKEAEKIQLQLEELEKLEDKLQEQRNKLATRQKAYTKEKEKLSAQLAERKKLQEKLNAREHDEADKIARLAKKAENLEGLLSNIISARKTAKKGKTTRLSMPTTAPKGRKGKVRSFAKAKGKIRPPLAGEVIRAYGKKSKKNETNKGMTIQARPGAQVTAPYDGEVVYVGRFLNYGRMVIIHHSDDFHTLLAGFAKIDTSAGEFLLEGEPIGAMGSRESSARLYVELRKKNQPIDPAPWMH